MFFFLRLLFFLFTALLYFDVNKVVFMWPTFALYPQGKEHGCLLMKKHFISCSRWERALPRSIFGDSLGQHQWEKKLNWLKCRTADPQSQELGISSVTGSHGGVVT